MGQYQGCRKNPFGVEFQTGSVVIAHSIVRQAKLGASCRVKVPAGQGLASHPYRVLRDREG